MQVNEIQKENWIMSGFVRLNVQFIAGLSIQLHVARLYIFDEIPRREVLK